MQHRWYPHSFADFSESRACLFHGCLRPHQSSFGGCRGAASCLHYQYVVCYQFLHQRHVHRVLGDRNRIAAHNASDASDSSVYDIAVKGPVGTSERATQHVLYVFVAEAGYQFAGFVRDVDSYSAAEITDRLRYQFPGRVEGIMIVEFYMGCARYRGFWIGCDDLSMVIFGNAHKRLHYALDVHYHHLHSASYDGKFLVQEVPCQRNAMSEQDFVSGTAYTTHVYPFSACRFRQFQHLRVLRLSHDHL